MTFLSGLENHLTVLQSVLENGSFFEHGTFHKVV